LSVMVTTTFRHAVLAFDQLVGEASRPLVALWGAALRQRCDRYVKQPRLNLLLEHNHSPECVEAVCSEVSFGSCRCYVLGTHDILNSMNNIRRRR
jgi:hypothetical protein